MVSVRTEAIAGLINSGSVPVVASIAPGPQRCRTQRQCRHGGRAAWRSPSSGAAGRARPTWKGCTATGPTAREVITELSATELRELMPNLEAGMVPKMEACLRAVEGGLTRATVADGRVPHALLLEIFTNVGIGTMVTQDGLIRLGSRVFSRDEGIPPQ